MLVKKIEKNTNVVVKLSNNDEVLGRLEHQNELQVILHKPKTLQMTPDGKAVLVPFVQCGNDDQDVTISKSHVVTIVPMRDDLSKAYTGATSGIIPAQSVPELKMS